MMRSNPNILRWAALAVGVLWVAWGAGDSRASQEPTPPASPETEESVMLFLEDGQVLEGLTVRREEDLLYLTLETGSVLTIPAALVVKMRLAAAPKAPTGMRKTQGETLPGSGGPGRLPTREEQRKQLTGTESRFRPPIVDPIWKPTNAYSTDPDLNNFNPAKWYRAPIDPFWKPVSAFTTAGDVTHFRPTRWSTSPIDPSWYPKDGFLARDRFWERPNSSPAPGISPAEPDPSPVTPPAEKSGAGPR